MVVNGVLVVVGASGVGQYQELAAVVVVVDSGGGGGNDVVTVSIKNWCSCGSN